MNGNLLVDIRPFNRQLITESKETGNLVVEGLMQVAGDLNGNGRIYPREILEEQIDRFKKTFIAQGNAYGELDHPESPIVSMKNVSHVIKDLWWEGDNVMGRIEVLPTVWGNIVKAVLESGYTIGISSRGTGSVKELSNGKLEVQPDFELVTWDFVSNPSVQGAFMKPVSQLNESMQSTGTNRFSKLDGILNDILRG